MANTYDAIVIGGGHNGLCAGAYLAKSGANTIVLEKRYKTGGAAETSTPWPEHPDFKVTTYSYVSGLIPPSVVKELQLERRGYKIFPMGPVYQAYPDGRSLQFDSGDTAANVPRISKFSERDAARLGKYDAWLEELADILGPLLMKVPPKLGSKKIGDLLDLGKLSWGLRKNINQRTVADFTRRPGGEWTSRLGSTSSCRVDSSRDIDWAWSSSSPSIRISMGLS